MTTTPVSMAQPFVWLRSQHPTRSVWVSYDPPMLPLATVGLGLLRVSDPIRPPEGGNQAWVNVTGPCAFQFYLNYVYSPNYRYSVPTYKRYNC